MDDFLKISLCKKKLTKNLKQQKLNKKKGEKTKVKPSDLNIGILIKENIGQYSD